MAYSDQWPLLRDRLSKAAMLCPWGDPLTGLIVLEYPMHILHFKAIQHFGSGEIFLWLLPTIDMPAAVLVMWLNLVPLTSGPGCSKLMTLLVNISLKFIYFLLKKCEKLLQRKSFSHFFNKKITVFGYKVVQHLMSWPLNELIKLRMLWTTGPRWFQMEFESNQFSGLRDVWNCWNMSDLGQRSKNDLQYQCLHVHMYLFSWQYISKSSIFPKNSYTIAFSVHSNVFWQ